MNQGSVLGALVFIWFVVGMIASYAHSSGERRRGFLALLLGVLATLAIVGAGEEIGLAMSQPSVNKWLGIGATVLFGLMMIDCLRGIRRNGVKPLALAVFILVLAFLVLACTGCAKYEQAKNEYAERQGLDRELFDLWPGGSLEGGSLQYVSWQDNMAIFEYNTNKGLDWACFDGQISLKQRTYQHRGEIRVCHGFLGYGYISVKFGGSWYAAHINSISATSGVASVRLDYD